MKERRRVLAKAAPKPMPRLSVAEDIHDEEMDDADNMDDVEMADEQDIQVGLSI